VLNGKGLNNKFEKFLITSYKLVQKLKEKSYVILVKENNIAENKRTKIRRMDNW